VPELPEVETTVRGLAPVLDGRVIARVEVRRPDLRRPFPPDLAERLTGARVTGLDRRAKYGIVRTDRGDAMIFHLGMSGRWRLAPDVPHVHDHLVIGTADGGVAALNDARRFGSVDIVPAADLAAFAPFAVMGPEPLGPDLHAEHLLTAFDRRTAPVKAMLLDQRVVAGLGNIYVCEALHMARIAPSRAAGRIGVARLERLVTAIRDVLAAAIAAGGSTIRDYAQPGGELGYFASQWRVYGREGLVCSCGATVRRRAEGGRSTFWCPACQRG
jgi:formamidopyrimidine-DNA glycosylase